MDIVFAEYSEIDIYNIYAPKCNLNTSSSSSAYNGEIESSLDANNYGSRRTRIFGGYDPCYATYAEEYFNIHEVQNFFHANTRGGRNSSIKWQVCNDSILREYNYTTFSILPIYSKLIKAGMRIWIYSGDADGRVPVTGSRYWIEALDLPLISPWRSWFHHHQVGGRVVEYEGLTFATIRGAGHLVPLNKPSEGLLLFNSFLKGRQLPEHR
jgi:serine carboxypeptidase-like clade 2